MTADRLLPAIMIDHFEVEVTPRGPRRRALPVQHPLVDVFEHVRRRYDASIGAFRRFSPRRESRVERRVDVSVDDVLSAIPFAFEYDPVEHEFRAPVRLKVRWSWPTLPVWLAVSEASRRQATLSVRLRSRKRWRYPVRYYPTAHEFLRTARWDSGSPGGRALA